MSNGKKPTHKAFTVRDYTQNEQQKSDWTEIGACWPNQDGDGFTLILAAIPVDGKIVVRRIKEKIGEGSTAGGVAA